MVKKTVVFLIIAAFLVTGCSILLPKKRYQLELQVKCPQGKTYKKAINGPLF